MKPQMPMSSRASRPRLVRASAAAILILGSTGLGGCGLFQDHRPAWAKDGIKPVALPAAAPDARSDDGLYADAVNAITQRDYASALDALQAARARDQGDPRVWNAFGVVYDKLGRFDLSGRYYAKAAALDPGSPIVANNRAYSRLIQTHGAPAEAEATVLARAEATPDSVAGPAALNTGYVPRALPQAVANAKAASPGPGRTRPVHASLVSRVAALLRRETATAPVWTPRPRLASAGDARIDLGRQSNPARRSVFAAVPARPTILASANPSTGKTDTP